MASITKTFLFTGNAETWQTAGGTADTTLQWSSVGGNTGGCVSSRIFGRNKSADPRWYWAGTWEDLGVPQGATVTHIQLLGFDWRCSEWNTGSNLTQVLAAKLYDSAGITQIAALSASQPTFSGTTSYSSISGAQQSIGSSYQASNTSVQLWFDFLLRTANNASAAVTLLMDNFSVEVTYTESTGGTIENITGSSSPQFLVQGSVTGKATVNGNPNLSFLSSGTITAKGIISASDTIAFQAQGSISGNQAPSGAMEGGSVFSFSVSGNILARGRLNGSLVSSFTNNAISGAKGSLSGLAAFAISPTGNIGAIFPAGALNGTSQASLAVAGQLQGKGILGCSDAISFSQSGSLYGKGYLDSEATASLTLSGVISGKLSAEGNVSLTFTTLGTLLEEGGSLVVFDPNLAKWLPVNTLDIEFKIGVVKLLQTADLPSACLLKTSLLETLIL